MKLEIYWNLPIVRTINIRDVSPKRVTNIFFFFGSRVQKSEQLLFRERSDLSGNRTYVRTHARTRLQRETAFSPFLISRRGYRRAVPATRCESKFRPPGKFCYRE